VIPVIGFQSSLFQSFAREGWMLDVSGLHFGFITEYPVSSIRRRLNKLKNLKSALHQGQPN
jgi:hypothetical protein